MTYELISAVELPERLAPLFDAYQQWLIQNDPDLQIVLNGQSYDDELEHLQEKYGASWLPSDFKKRNGYLRSIQLSAEYGLYRQAWCGCGLGES